MTIVLFLLALIFIFFLPPLGIVLLIIAVISLIIDIIKITGKATVKTGKFIAEQVNTKKCPYCYSQIDVKATVCPLCHKDIPYEDSKEKDKNVGCNNESYSTNIEQENIPMENGVLCDYKLKLSELSKIYKLYENNIYNEYEYKSKKEAWIESLKILSFHNIETDFLENMLTLVNSGILHNEEVEVIKYIVSGEYAKDKYRKEQEDKLKLEEDKKRKRKETIENVKTEIQGVMSSVTKKIMGKNNELALNCEEKIEKGDIFCTNCGKKFEKEDVFCTNCGKKIK